jgi:Fur family zinc uptake transcriptional regulator
VRSADRIAIGGSYPGVKLAVRGWEAYFPAMAHVHHHKIADGAELEAEAQAALEGAGEQWTPMRATVFSALAGFDRPASAYDIADSISKSEDRRVAANSVYRILDLFVAKNLAQRVETANAYVVNAHPACRHDCIFLVCDRCGQTTHIDDDALTDRVRKAADAAGFTPVRPVIEVTGRCRNCAGD